MLIAIGEDIPQAVYWMK